MNNAVKLMLVIAFIILCVCFSILSAVFGAYVSKVSTSCPNVNSKNAKMWKNVCIACAVLFGIIACLGLFGYQYNIHNEPASSINEQGAGGGI